MHPLLYEEQIKVWWIWHNDLNVSRLIPSFQWRNLINFIWLIWIFFLKSYCRNHWTNENCKEILGVIILRHFKISRVLVDVINNQDAVKKIYFVIRRCIDRANRFRIDVVCLLTMMLSYLDQKINFLNYLNKKGISDSSNVWMSHRPWSTNTISITSHNRRRQSLFISY